MAVLMRSGVISAATPIANNNLSTKAYVDAAIVSAANTSGGGGSCYYTSLPICLSGYTRAPGISSNGMIASLFICCPGTAPTNGCVDYQPGLACANNTIYAFYYSGSHYMTTPGNCDDSTTPFCKGDTDTLTKAWSTENILRNATSTSNGSGNTTIIMALSGGINYPAIKYCGDMIYGGYTDWYLPSQDELTSLLANQSTIGNLGNSYWSSTENTAGQAMFWNTGFTARSKSSGYAVRCIRKI